MTRQREDSAALINGSVIAVAFAFVETLSAEAWLSELYLILLKAKAVS